MKKSYQKPTLTRSRVKLQAVTAGTVVTLVQMNKPISEVN